MDVIENDFYYILGQLSTKFAIAEQYCQDILCLLIGKNDNNLLALTLIEGNSLSKNLELLGKIVKIDCSWELEIAEMKNRLDKIRVERNLFIHGLWLIPTLHSETSEVTVETRNKIKYSETIDLKTSRRDFKTRSWRTNDFKHFNISDLKAIVVELDGIIEVQKRLIKEIIIDIEQ